MTVAFGTYINGEGEGAYLRVGLGTGLEADGGVEGGESKNRAAFEKGASEKCGSVSAPGVCVSRNSAGTTGSGSLSLGAPVGYHSASTYTFTTKPTRTVVSPDNFDCSKPHPQNHVCNR